MKTYLVTKDGQEDKKLFTQDVVRYLKRAGVADEEINVKWLENSYFDDSGNEIEVTFWDEE